MIITVAINRINNRYNDAQNYGSCKRYHENIVIRYNFIKICCHCLVSQC